MTDIRYIQSTERQVGEAHPTLSDTLNRALRDVLTGSGLDPDADFGGFTTGPSGTGSPEGAVTADVGQIYRQTDGANGTVLWVKNSGTGNTGWRVMQTSLGVVNVKDYGAVGDGVTSDTAAVVAAFATAPRKVVFPYGTYQLPALTTLTVPDGCEVDLGGSALNVTSFATADDVVFDMGNNTVLRNGTIAPTLAGTPSTGDKSIPVRIGQYAAYPGGKDNVTIEDIFIDGTNAGTNSNGIGIFGDSRNIAVRRISIDGGGRVGRGVLAHWSAADPAAPVTTSHPNTLTIEDISATDMATAYADGGAVCLSACYGVTIRNVTTDSGYYALNFLPGDWGIDYAPAAIAPLVGTGITAENVVGYGVLRAVQILGLPTVSGAVYDYPVHLGSCSFYGTDSASHSGINLASVTGVEIVDCVVQHFNHGLSCGGDVDNLRVLGGTYQDNLAVGIRITNTSNPPQSPLVRGAIVRRNNTGGQVSDDRAGINIATSTDAIIEGCLFGVSASETQFYSVRASTTAVRPKLYNNHTIGLAVGGAAYSVANSTSYDVLASGFGNTAESGLTLRGGTPFAFALDGGNVTTSNPRVVYLTAAPAAGTWNRGDITLNLTPGTTGPLGWLCSTAGTPGTWQTIGIGDAPLASPTFTGTPAAPTQTANDNSTKLATTAYVDRATTRTAVTSAAPTGTTSTTAKMMGLAGSITPTRGTRILIFASGQLSNDTINDGATVDLRYGTGSAPANGDAVTGTLAGIEQAMTAKVAADRSGFSLLGYVTGLTVGTAYWLDLSLKAVTGGTATVTGVSLVAVEEH